MFLNIAVTVPANTTAASPVKRVVALTPGVIHQVDVQFPAGCAGLVHAQCFRGAHQVWPTNDGADFASDAQTLTWQEDYELDAAPFTIEIRAWNTDDTYSHEVTWRFALRNFPEAKQQALLQLVPPQKVTTLELD